MLFKSLENIKEDTLANTPTNICFSTEEYNYSTFLKKIQEGRISESELEYEIGNHISKYCDYDGFKKPETRKIFQSLWTNQKFLDMFLKIVSEHNDIANYIKKYYNISLCKITYDYYVEIGSNIDNDPITKTLISIIQRINNANILPLTTFIKKIDATFIVLAKYSSFNQEECVERVNEFIIRLGYDFSVKQIIDIYSYLYSSESFTPIFNISMTQLYDLDNLNILEKSIYYRMNSALLTIVNSMTSKDIYKLLNSYAIYKSLYNKESRFNILDHIEDYDRIKPIISQLQLDGVDIK